MANVEGEIEIWYALGEEGLLRKRSMELSVRVMTVGVGFDGVGETKGVQMDAICCGADGMGNARPAVLALSSKGSLFLDAMPCLAGTRGGL